MTSGALTLDGGADRAATEAALRALPGIGPWTAAYTVMRGLGDPNAIPLGDLGLRRAAATLGIDNLAARAGSWQPWRAYAAMHLWQLEE